MANVQARLNKDGLVTSYSIRVFEGVGADGKRVYRNTTFKYDPSKSPKTNQKNAEKYATLFERDVQNGIASTNRITVSEYMSDYIESKKQIGLHHSTIATYSDYADNLNPLIGHMKIKEVTPIFLNRMFQTMKTKNGKQASAHMVKEHRVFLHGVFAQAVRENLIPYNPVDRIITPRVEKPEIEVFSQEQIDTLKTVIGSLPVNWKCMFTLLMATGMRRGELLGLKWSDVDWDKQTVNVSQNVIYTRKEGIIVGTPKTKSSIRTIALPPTALDVLKEYKAYQAQERLRLGEYFQDQNFIFTQDNGSPICPQAVSNYARRTISDLCGFRIHPHAFRHLQASLLIEKGMPITAVSARLGHSSVSLTLDVYSRSVQHADAANADKIQELLFAQS